MAKTAKMQEVSIDDLVPYERNAKTHDAAQIEKLKASMQEFGFISPILIDEQKNIIAGHGRVMAARELGLKTVPAVYVEGLTEAQRKAYIIADNRLTELGGWDNDLLEEELRQLTEEGFNVELTGFDIPEESDSVNAGDADAELNPTATLPESRIIVASVSAFGTNSEKIILLKLSQELADKFLRRCDELTTGEIAAKLVEALDAI